MATLQQYRQALASSRDLGGYVAFTSTSASATSTATQEVISTALMDDTNNVSSRYANAWLLGVSGGTSAARLGEQRRIRQYGFDGATGTLTVTRAFGATPATAHNWELYFRIPAIRDEQGTEGYREIINTALRTMLIHDWISVSGVSDQTKYTLNLSSYPWLRDVGSIVNVWCPTPNSTDLERVDTQTWNLFSDGETLILQLPQSYTNSDTFKIEVLRPANSRLKVSGAWQDQTGTTDGLTSDTDEAIPSVNDVVTVAREIAFAQLGKFAPEAEARFWAAREAEARRRASAVKFALRRTTEPKPLNFFSGDMAVWR